MVVEVIYVVRHAVSATTKRPVTCFAKFIYAFAGLTQMISQFRTSFSVNPRTGEYHSGGPFPTGIPSDAVLTSHGVHQSEELAVHLENIEPPIDAIYCSPYYRCLQTLLPYTKRLFPKGKAGGRIRVENGLGYDLREATLMMSYRAD